jgi:AcrR family transcriptional regulator
MNKQSEITERTRENLIAAFWKIYCKKRIEKISVKEITMLAGYNRGTFYEYFADVYDVLEQLENSLLPTMDKLPPTTSASEAEQVSAVFKMYEKNSKYYVVLLGDNGDPAFQSKIKNCIKPMLMQMFGEKSDLPPAELDYALEYMLSALLGVLGYWYRQEKPLPPEQLIPLMNDLSHNKILSKLLS